jgi:Fe-S cluster assembly ATP-binding protein
MTLLKIKDLYASIGDEKILNGLSLEIKAGETHAIMGPNGSGKSTLSYVLSGREDYDVSEGSVLLDSKEILDINSSRVAKNLPELEGIELVKLIREKAAELEISQDMLKRFVNVGFSGGEKKRFEILQMALLDPKIAVLDETDSGLDVDALRIVGKGVTNLKSKDRGMLVITHYQRLLDHIIPDFVHIMVKGKIIKSGGPDLAKLVEKEGYKSFLNGN